MCGIAGFFNYQTQEPIESGLLEAMIGVLHHRGPDETGYHREAQVGLAHARLSIIDLSTGQQPMANEDGTLWVVYNGEIYNYVELVPELKNLGHRFKTTSDTEVILHAYEEWGDECVHRFNGQFAFALWDSRRQEMFLARDRMGVRPLYYTARNGRFYFASEIKSLFQCDSIPREIDPFALDQVFTFWFSVYPRTGFKDIWEVPPGHTLRINQNGLALQRYWSLTFPEIQEWRPSEPKEEKAFVEELTTLLADSVRIRLRADVSIGAYLSGGLDSSLTTALIRQEIHEKLETFSIGFEAAAFDESTFQQEMVRHLNTTHHFFHCHSEEIGLQLPQAVYHMEKPVLRLAPIPMMLLSHGVRETGIKVVLTGEGSDEILGGYDIYKEAKIRRFWAVQPESRIRPNLLRRLYPYLPGMQGQSLEILKSFFQVGLTDTSDLFYSHRPRWRVASALKNFYSESMRCNLKEYDPVEELRHQLPGDFSRWHPFSQAQYLEGAYLLPCYLLSSQGDRMGMANSVEGRFPFLDHRVAELAARIPPNLKMRRLREKHVLKEAAKPLLPMGIVERTKQPYNAPDHASLYPKSIPQDYIASAFSSPGVEAAGLFSVPAVAALHRKAQKVSELGTRDGMALVGLLSSQLIHEQFIERKPNNNGKRS
jgi:asparagine synthase (glutamine-hydrolysing)